MTASETDRQLVQRAQRGDLRAFDLLVLKYQGRIAALVSRYISDASEVEDVTQEASAHTRHSPSAATPFARSAHPLCAAVLPRIDRHARLDLL